MLTFNLSGSLGRERIESHLRVEAAASAWCGTQRRALLLRGEWEWGRGEGTCKGATGKRERRGLRSERKVNLKKKELRLQCCVWGGCCPAYLPSALG